MTKGGLLIVGAVFAATFGFIGYQAAEVRRKSPKRVETTSELTAVPAGAEFSSGSGGARVTEMSDDVLRGDQAVRDALELNRSRTYMGEVLEQNSSTVRRWPTRTARAIRIWIADPEGVPGGIPSGQRFVRQAFDDWTLIGLPVAFEMVANRASADIAVLWAERLSEKRVGVTRMTGVDDFYTRGSITLATHRPNGDVLLPQHVASTALHEVGHMLGLGHSSDSSSVMYPEMNEEIRTRRIAQIDRATVHLLYRLPVGKVR